MRKIDVIKSKNYLCNFCDKNYCEYEIKNNGRLMFCLCKECYKDLISKLTESYPKENE